MPVWGYAKNPIEQSARASDAWAYTSLAGGSQAEKLIDKPFLSQMKGVDKR
jgi:hypothetical protein